MQGGRTLAVTAATAPEPTESSHEEAVEFIREWRNFAGTVRIPEAHDPARQQSRSQLRPLSWWVAGTGSSRALTGRRLYLIKEWDPRFERWTVKGTDCVSAIWMMTEADALKRAMGWILEDFDAHPRRLGEHHGPR